MNKPKNSGKTVAAGVTLAAAVGVAIVAAIFMRGGGTGDGAGSGTGPADGTGSGTGKGASGSPATLTSPQTQQSPADVTAPQRPLKVTIRESAYLVDGREVDLAQLGELAAKVPEGPGVAVTIERDSTSRAKAELDLIKALDEKDLKHSSD